MENFRFVLEKIDPRVSAKVINEGNIISMIANRERSRPHTSE